MIQKASLNISNKNLAHVSNIFKTIYKKNGNVLKSHVLQDENKYIVNLKAEYSNKYRYPPVLTNPLVTPLPYKKVFNKHCRTYPKKRNEYPFYLSFKLNDTTGIIHKTLDNVNDINLDLYEMRSFVELAPVCGTRLFTLSMYGAVPNYYKYDLQNRVNILQKEFGNDVLLKPL